jgi:hypothetical protein
LHIFSWPDKKYQYFCPPPVPKNSKNRKSEDDAAAPGAMTGEDYSLILHCTVGHMRRVDGALPDFEDGEKAVNFFAPPPTPMYIFYIFYIFDIFTFSRHTIRASQPVFGFWYYFMIHRAIGVSLQRILPKFLPRTEADIDELLSCKLRV